ncbi:leukotriene B4 receptor 1-like [Sebastes fasciatus]|uniref:leukotriene B4 receptor 1-like n=1 Tax=Sebastes fasciatus TaxID=394691 RepID=UPI003D9EFF2E
MQNHPAMIELVISRQDFTLNIELVCQQVCGMEQLNSSVVPSNISSSPGHPYPASWVSTGLIPAIVLSFCFLLGVPGNIAVIILRPNWQHLSTLSQSLMLNLAISDLLCLLTLPLLIYSLLHRWTLGLVTCKLMNFLTYCSIFSSLLTVMALSVQRYLQVVHPQRCFNQVGRKRLLVLLWLVAMILSIPTLVVKQLTTDQNRTICESHFSSPGQRISVLLAESLPGYVSIIVVIIAYSGLHRKVNQAVFFNNPQTTRLVTSIIVTFFILCVPYHITNVLDVAAILLKNDGLLKFCMNIRNIFAALVFVNSCLNPLLYAFASRNMCTVCQKRELTVDAEAQL